ncbi:MAG: hypothetical protein J5861_02305 [Desulfovibrio sp.]|nr:hypothetical protein [Desulfovibrio sp.]
MINIIQNAPISLDHLQGTLTQPQSQVQHRPGPQVVPQDDNVSVRNPQLMTDEEAMEAMSQVQDSLQQSTGEALSVHGGLDYSRVMALLADV